MPISDIIARMRHDGCGGRARRFGGAEDRATRCVASWLSRSLTYMAHERARVHQMTKAELIAAIADAPDDTPIYILNPEDGRRRSRPH
jgi:hypothetical protein